ncbi:MAG: Maf family protein [Treponema sp.]|nr:Maf family protein [Spirochaetia bacterium]MDD7458525.1 Maf family protein [Spirochaetales bacterium]MDY5810957.1 Maf family protein [Treponema sp.]
MEPIILASSSPRRQQILKNLGIPFIVHPANIEETIPSDIKIEDAPEYLAARKIDAVVRSIAPDREIGWILAADTAIVYKNKIYGKPKDKDEAREFLKTLQGNTHKVITGIALYNGAIHYISTRTSINKVTFAPMSDHDIEWYLSTSEWYGVAGAYRIQENGSCFIKKIEGTESSIVGLPIYELCDMLREQNYKFFEQ